jgi:hypothetical protein
VVRNQFGPAAEALYVKRLFQALENAPYNGVGGCPLTDHALRPPAQQPGKTGTLRIR